MSQFDSILSAMKNETYSTKKQLLGYLLHTVQNSRQAPDQDDKAAILKYAYSEVDDYLSAIPNAGSYQEKDVIFHCENLVLDLISRLCRTPKEIPEDIFAKIKVLIELTAKERYIENTIDSLFKQETIEAPEVDRMLGLVRQTSDEYQKGKLYAGLLHYAIDIAKLSDDAKARIAAYISAEFRRYLDQDQRTEDCIANLELASDVSKYFANDSIVCLLNETLKLGYCNINFYAVDTLLSLGQEAPTDVIHALAKNLEYANLTYSMLTKFGKQELFPKEYSSPEYLAKSDLIHWLMYPTELGKEPDEIEYIGKITYPFKKEVYYVFKYRSDSDTLDDGLKNKWLIGWSSDDGGTFSNFDEYALFEKGSIKATLKNIKKKLL